MALFRLFAWRLFVFSHGVISGRKDEMAQISHHTKEYFLQNIEGSLRARLGSRKTDLSTQYYNTDRSKAVILSLFFTITCSCSPYLYIRSPIVLVTCFS